MLCCKSEQSVRDKRIKEAGAMKMKFKKNFFFSILTSTARVISVIPSRMIAVTWETRIYVIITKEE